ncbi:MAG: cupin domain-containing protein [Pirellulales bacterium]
MKRPILLTQRRHEVVRMTFLVFVSSVLAAVPAITDAVDRPDDKAARMDAQHLAKMLQSFDKVEVQEFEWGWIRWLMSSKLDPQAQMTFGIVQLNAGEVNPVHKHPNCEEVLYVLSGRCEHHIGKQTVLLKPGDLLRIPLGVPHAAKVIGEEPMRAVIVYNTGDRQFEVVEE